MLYGPTGLNSFLWQFVFVILSVPRRAPRDITGHLSTSRQICYDKYSDKYRRHNLVTNVQLSLRLMTTGSVSHRRGIMTHLLWPEPYRHCCVIEGVQWQEKDYNCHNQLVIEGLTSCSGGFLFCLEPAPEEPRPNAESWMDVLHEVFPIHTLII